MTNNPTTTSADTYALRPEGLKESNIRVLKASIPISLIFLLYIGYSLFWNQRTDSSGFDVSLIMVPFMIGLVLYSISRNLRSQKKAWQSYRLQMDENSITRQHAGLRDLTIRQEEITEILETSKQDLVVKTAHKETFIAVPRWIEQPETVRERLEAFKPIQPQPTLNFWQKYPLVMTLGFMVWFGFHFFSTIPWVIIATGIPIVPLLVWSAYSVWKSKHVVKRVKWSMVVIPLLVLVIIVRVLAAWGVF